MKVSEQLSRTVLLCRDYVSDGLSDEEIRQQFQGIRVLFISDLRNLSSHSGQTALTTLVSLLSRMGIQIGLQMPDVEMLFAQPPFSGGASLLRALISSSDAIVTGATVCRDLNVNPHLVFALGDTKIGRQSVPTWRLCGNDWAGSLISEGSIESWPWVGEWPIGAMISSALAANEAFKFVIRNLPLRNSTDDVYFELSPFCSWDFGSVQLPTGDLDLGEVDVISGGAISQAALYALLRVPKVHLSGRVFDDDVTANSNLNRNMLTLISDVGTKKVLVIARCCAPKLQLEPVPDLFAGKATQTSKLAPRVLVGVDDIPSRWEVQRCASGWLAVSGTSHFSISSSSHAQHESCCGCLHPIDDIGGSNPIPTISFVSFWAGLTMAVRLLREAITASFSQNQRHLWLTPLRMDQPHAGMWLPVAPRRDCPVHCHTSQLA